MRLAVGKKPTRGRVVNMQILMGSFKAWALDSKAHPLWPMYLSNRALEKAMTSNPANSTINRHDSDTYSPSGSNNNRPMNSAAHGVRKVIS